MVPYTQKLQTLAGQWQGMRFVLNSYGNLCLGQHGLPIISGPNPTDINETVQLVSSVQLTCFLKNITYMLYTNRMAAIVPY